MLSPAGYATLAGEEIAAWRAGVAAWVANCLAQEVAVAQMYAETLTAQDLDPNSRAIAEQLQESILNAAYEVRSVIRLLEHPPHRPAIEPDRPPDG